MKTIINIRRARDGSTITSNWRVMVMGILSVADGLVHLLSFGFLGAYMAHEWRIACLKAIYTQEEN